MFALRTESMPRSQLYEKNLFVPGMLTRYVCRASRSLWLITEKRFKTANTSRRLSQRTFPQKQRHKQSVFKQRHKRFYTQTPLQFTDNFFTQKNLSSKVPLRKTFTQRSFYKENFLHRKTFTHKKIAHKTFHTKQFLHTNAFTHRNLYPQKRLHKKNTQRNFTHRGFYTKMF